MSESCAGTFVSDVRRSEEDWDYSSADERYFLFPVIDQGGRTESLVGYNNDRIAESSKVRGVLNERAGRIGREAYPGS